MSKAASKATRDFLRKRKRNLVNLKTQMKAEIRQIEHLSITYEGQRAAILKQVDDLDKQFAKRGRGLILAKTRLHAIENDLSQVKCDLGQVGHTNRKRALLKRYQEQVKALEGHINAQTS